MTRHILSILPAALLIVALLPLPIGYYTLLRIVVTAIAAWIAWREGNNGRRLVAALFVVIALLFNPVFPVHLNSRALWTPIDLCASGIFLFYALVGFYRQRKRRGSQSHREAHYFPPQDSGYLGE